MSETIHCVCCGNEVQLQRDEHNRSLQVGCGCAYRSVKVKEALPWDWNHD